MCGMGAREGNSWSGTAYSVSGKCESVPFSVKGSVSGDDRIVTLIGKAPQIGPSNCQVVGYRDDALVFNFLKFER